MDRIIEVKVCGNYISKDNKNAGVRGEANVTKLRISFDEGWIECNKKITFWDARGLNPVEIWLYPTLAENYTTYIVPIPKEPMEEAGLLTFVIEGTKDDKIQRSVSDKLEVKDSPIATNASEPVPPTEDELTQLAGELEKIKNKIIDVFGLQKDEQVIDFTKYLAVEATTFAVRDSGELKGIHISPDGLNTRRDDFSNIKSNKGTLQDILNNIPDIKIDGGIVDMTNYTAVEGNCFGVQGGVQINPMGIYTGKSDFSTIYTSDGRTLQDELDKKVEAVSGKQLSSNDYTNEEKQKLSDLPEKTENNVLNAKKYLAVEARIFSTNSDGTGVLMQPDGFYTNTDDFSNIKSNKTDLQTVLDSLRNPSAPTDCYTKEETNFAIYAAIGEVLGGAS